MKLWKLNILTDAKLEELLLNERMKQRQINSAMFNQTVNDNARLAFALRERKRVRR